MDTGPIMKSVFVNRKKRSKEEIIASILFTTRQGTSKTGIMYANYLSFSQLNKYINFGLKARIIYMNGDGKYFTTPRGLAYLNCFEEVQSMENSAVAKRRLLNEILIREQYS
jgi:predicted transcriptional regulator